MSHFAEISSEGIVLRVIVADQSFVDSMGNPQNWVQTSYNVSHGKYTRGATESEKIVLSQLGTNKDITARNRKNYAGVGYTYDKVRDAFIPPKRFDSWVLNEEKCVYEAPVAYPKDGKMYQWNEGIIAWVESNESKEAAKVTPK